MLGESTRVNDCALLGLILIVGVGGCRGKQAAAPDQRATAAPRGETPAPEAPATFAATSETLEPAESNDEPDKSAAPFSTPEATFAALRKGAIAVDIPQIMDCFTSDGGTEVVGAAWLMSVILLEDLKNPKIEAESRMSLIPIQQALEKHVPSSLLPQTIFPSSKSDPFPKDFDFRAPADKLRAQVRSVGSQINERNAFLAEFLKALFDEFAVRGEDGDEPIPMKNSRLEDLKIDGDHATGVLTRGLFGLENAPIHFVRVGNDWKIETLGDYSFGSSEKDKSQ